MEQSLSDTQHRLSVKMNELHASHQQIEKLEETIGEYLWILRGPGWTAIVGVVLLLRFFLWLSALFLFCPTGELSQRGSKHKEEMFILQKSISALDREKDALQDEVDEKTEKLVVLQEELSKKVAKTNKHHQDCKLLLKDRLNTHMPICTVKKVIGLYNHSPCSY